MSETPGAPGPLETPDHHPNPDTLADHAEGLLPSAQAAEVARHLLTCATCRETRDGLAEVSTLLTAYADPGPMPNDVAARIDAALAAAGPLAGDEPDEEPPPVPAAAATVVPEQDAGRPTRLSLSSKVLQIAAVVVLVAAVGALGVSALIANRGSSGGSASAGSGQSTGDKAAAGSAAGGATAATLFSASGTAYTLSNLPAVGHELALGTHAKASTVLPAPETASPPGTAAATPTSGGTRSPEFAASLPLDQRVLADSRLALDACTRRLTGATTRPVAVDLGTWAGTPATVVVLPDPDDATMLDVYVVRASCPPGVFLSFVRIPR